MSMSCESCPSALGLTSLMDMLDENAAMVRHENNRALAQLWPDRKVLPAANVVLYLTKLAAAELEVQEMADSVEDKVTKLDCGTTAATGLGTCPRLACAADAILTQMPRIGQAINDLFSEVE